MTSSTTLSDVANKIATVVNRGTWNGSITGSEGSIYIPVGYHSGNGKVTGPSLASLVGSNVNLDSGGYLLSGYSAYGKNGSWIGGTMIDRSHNTGSANLSWAGNVNWQPDGTNPQYYTSGNQLRTRVPTGYYGDTSLVIAGIVKGNLDWSGVNTSYSVPAGYYTGGTLSSTQSYSTGWGDGAWSTRNVIAAAISYYGPQVSANNSADELAYYIKRMGGDDFGPFWGAMNFCINGTTGWGTCGAQKIYAIPAGSSLTVTTVWTNTNHQYVNDVAYKGSAIKNDQGYGFIAYNSYGYHYNANIIASQSSASYNRSACSITTTVTTNARGVLIGTHGHKNSSGTWKGPVWIVISY